MNLIFLGPPGSGKGTQALKLSKQESLIHLSTGDVLREAVKNETELGKKAKEYMDAGNLVPDALIVGLIQEKIKNGHLGNGFILDGFPRTIPQAEALKMMLENHSLKLDYAICFHVEDDKIVKRMAGRRFCPVCQTTYNVYVEDARPKVDGKCDKDNEDLIIRTDDLEDVVRNRLVVYHKQTKPIVEFYRNESILVEIDADRAPEEVFNAILETVK